MTRKRLISTTATLMALCVTAAAVFLVTPLKAHAQQVTDKNWSCSPEAKLQMALEWEQAVAERGGVKPPHSVEQLLKDTYCVDADIHGDWDARFGGEGMASAVARRLGLPGLGLETVDGLAGPNDSAVWIDDDFSPDQFFRNPLNDLGAATLIGPSPDTSTHAASDFYGNDLTTLWAFTTVDELISFDVNTGTGVNVGVATSTGATIGTVNGFAYNPVDDLMYAVDTSEQVFTFVPPSLTWDFKGVITGLPLATIGALAADSSGTLWAVNDNDDSIYTIDSNTLAATLVGPVGTGSGGASGEWGLDFDPTDGTLYMIVDGFTSTETIAEINLSTGAGTVISQGAPAAADGPTTLAIELPYPLGGPQIPVDPNRQLGGQVHLPILNFQGQDDVCRTWIEVQYIGCDPSKAVLVTWGEPGFCPPQAAGPLKVECTGLLNPGSTWNLLGAQIPTGSKSGILFKFTARQLSELPGNPGPTLADDLGFDDVAADLMCETLFFGVVGDSDDYRRFKKAYNEGLGFAGVNQGVVSGEGVLAVEVLRHCPGDVTPGVEVSSRYNGIAGTHLGHYDPVFGGHGYYVPLIYAEKAGLNTVMYIQNGGLECSSVEIWFKAQDDCLRARICEIFTLAPGESYQWDASDCVGPDWQGSAWLRSSQVMGIAVDIFGRDILMTYIGEPQPYAYVIGEGDDVEIIETPTTGEQVAYGPLMYSEYQGWDTGVQVQNLDEVYNAKVKVYFLDRSGDVITTLVDWICPRGSQTFFLPVVADLPGSWIGSIRIESQEWWTPGTNPVDPVNIAGVATLMRYSDVARTDTQEAIAYNLLPEHKSYIWQVGSGRGGTFSGVGLIAIPSLLKDLDGTGTTSEVAIMNLVAKPGFTDFAIYIYDQNGLLDFVCQKLHDRQVEYIDLQTWGYVNNGFKGSAIISATFWEHDVFGPTGEFIRNLLGLGAVGVERTGTRLNEDVPGDEAAGSRGIPFERNSDLEVCLGNGVPTCPGQPPFDPEP